MDDNSLIQTSFQILFLPFFFGSIIKNKRIILENSGKNKQFSSSYEWDRGKKHIKQLMKSYDVQIWQYGMDSVGCDMAGT